MTIEYQNHIGSAVISETASAGAALIIDTTNTSTTKAVLKKAGANAQVAAVLMEACTAANDQCRVTWVGNIVQMPSDGSGTAISEGDYLKTDSSARVVKAATDKDKVVGIALAPSTAAGDLIPVVLCPFTLSA